MRKAVEQDKATFLEEAVASGSWRAIRKLKKPKAAKQGRLRNTAGELVSSEDRADAMATYLETVQWRVRPATAVDYPLLGPVLPFGTKL